MEFLGIGPLEFFFIIIIALIVLGPKDMVKAGRTLGRWLRTLVTSPGYRTIQQVSNDLRNLPNRLMREAGFDENGLPIDQQIRKELGMDEIQQAMQGVQTDIKTTSADLGNTIQQTNQDMHTAISDWTTAPNAQDAISDWTTPPITNPAGIPGNGAAPAEALDHPSDSSNTIIPGPPPPEPSEAVPNADPASPETPPQSS